MTFKTTVPGLLAALLIPLMVDCSIGSDVGCKIKHDCQGSIARNCVETYGEYFGNPNGSYFETQDCGSADLCVVTQEDAFCAARPGKDSRCTQAQYCDGTRQVTCNEGYAISIQACRSCSPDPARPGYSACSGSAVDSDYYDDTNTCLQDLDCAAGLTCIAGTCGLACTCPTNGQTCPDCQALPGFDSDLQDTALTCQSGRCGPLGSM